MVESCIPLVLIIIFVFLLDVYFKLHIDYSIPSTYCCRILIMENHVYVHHVFQYLYIQYQLGSLL